MCRSPTGSGAAGSLQQWGVLDFGGGMVVHGAAGFSALASIYVVKKRVFAPGEEEKPSNIPLIAIGLGILWFGWLGEIPANALAANGVAAQAFVNTFIAGGCAMVVWMFTDWVRIGKASMVGSLTGVLAGLVAVTPCAGYVPTWAAVFIALAAAGVCYGAVLLRKRLDWDDSLDVWGVHGVGGLFGSLMVGWFASGAVNGAGSDGRQPAAVRPAARRGGHHLDVHLRRDLRDLQGHRCARQPARTGHRPGRRPRRGPSRRDRLHLRLNRTPPGRVARPGGVRTGARPMPGPPGAMGAEAVGSGAHRVLRGLSNLARE